MKSPIIYTIIYAALYSILNVGGAGLIKRELVAFAAEGRSLSGPFDFVAFLLRLKVIVGFAIILLSALAMFKALSGERFSLVIPLSTGINFVLTVLVGTLFFQDRIGPLQAVGLAFVLGGIVLLSLAAKGA